ncbi:MAG: hypothetical protein EXS10_05570 [Phycisphaerales bacterium]|nr:hypothetical protein [Phycisphaerales bacterium]
MAHNQDWRELLLSFNVHHAEYIIVGGVALAYHGHPRYTGDLDVFIHASRENASRVLSALRDFGLGSLALSVDDLALDHRVIEIGFLPGRVDLLTSIDGVAWQEATSNAEMGDYAGVPTRYISRTDLIRNKRTEGRPQDLADVARLESRSSSVSPE